MIRVLIVDDSPTLRCLIRNVLATDPDLEVIGEAQDGQEAVEMVQRLDPDLITMDIHMPGMDGYSAIRRIMAEFPRPIIVLTSTESDIRLGTTCKGLESGALMVFGKPHGLPAEDKEAATLVEAVKAMADVKVVRRRWPTSARTTPPRSPSPPARTGHHDAFQIVALGTSTGGPPALQCILSQLPADFPLPVVVVQHISRGFTEGLARWLNQKTAIAVKIAEDGERLLPGTVYLAPDDRHLRISAARRVDLGRHDPVDGHRPSVTALFTSVAQVCGAGSAGVLLTGMGRDGAEGLAAIKRQNGYTLAQDEESSVVFGMPKEAIALGAAVEILPLKRIGPRIVGLVRERKGGAA